ncbi:thioesterase [Micromonospora qiuiae]|uniref:Thioesterase n=1 Tax=Micromonospora qiuiae TaxID=502268 RepID=A0ABQ4JG44_9ACTN|nr:alpha/beta fold hydrolase [Micromonospora qiuiae]GIJ29210.1 thioesterase [Micromonospora qiuiae]
MANEPNRWIRRYRAAPDAAVQLVCLPHAGGTASYYQPMAKSLFPEVEVLAVQYPGRQDRFNEPCIRDFAALTEGAFAAVHSALDDRPVALFGHSMGALLAFGLAKRLEANGIEPITLFPSAMRPAGRPHDLPHLASDDDLIAEIATLDGTEERLLDNEDMRTVFLPALRADYTALSTYRLDDIGVACPVVSLAGDKDDHVPAEDVATWAKHTTGPFDLHVFPGGHFYLNRQWNDVAAMLKQQVAGLS